MKNYTRRIARIALRDPLKIPALLRMKSFKTSGGRQGPSKTGVPPPLVIAIRTNYACNLRCVMCNQWGEEGVFVKTPERMVKREMAAEDVKRLIDDVAPFRPYIYFTGGEPLLNKDIAELIRHTHSRHLLVSMSTNATFLKARADELIDAGLDYLYTSLDAPVPIEQGAIRRDTQGEDSNLKAVEGIRHLIRRRDERGVGLPIVQTQTVVVQENQEHLLSMAHFVQDVLQADVWGLQLCVYTTPALNEATTRDYQKRFGQDQVGWAGFIREFPKMDFEGIERQIEMIRKTRWKFRLRLYRPTGMPGFDIRQYYTRPDLSTSDESLACLNPYVFAQIQPDGEVAFCGSQPDFTIGNVKQNRFLDLWNNERANTWRNFLRDHLFPSCKRCFSLHEFSRFKRD